ncbi:MAG: TetR family transcriptional regulator [Methylobacter sp.]|nr:MAG: TetR family transcriptional regulator [Methylobacter sp.]PPD20670.1 MAG: TetR family transcriptional regulator [Methylobacter sp.]PPD36872.1 MAG: TetR family transcriptional regulator [Methylomonas sp.]
MEKETETVQENTEAKNQILLVSLKLFADKGYFNTSLTDIKNELGLKGTSGIYQHFSNKQAIAADLHSSIMDSLSVSIDDIRRRNRKSSEQLREIVDLFFRLTQDAPDIMKFLLLVRMDEFLPQEQPFMQKAPYSKILKIIQAGIGAGEIRAVDPYLAYAYFFGVIEATLKLLLTGTLNKNPEVYLSQAWMAAWNSIAIKK